MRNYFRELKNHLLYYLRKKNQTINVNFDLKIKINSKKLILKYSNFFLENNVRVKLYHLNEELSDREVYVYKPLCLADALDENQFLNAVITLLNQNLDLIAVSEQLTEKENEVYCNNLQNNIIYKLNIEKKILNKEYATIVGKIISIPTRTGEYTLNHLNLKFLSIESYNLDKLQFFSNNLDDNLSKKKIVFVFPIYMAVGGVEKNTIEIMKSLKEKYNFVVINFEKLDSLQGSLHNELKDVCMSFYEFGDIIARENYLDFLRQLKEYYNPELVWICNGSPWLVKNAEKIRGIFKDIGIVDQEVYDTKEGWVQYITSNGIKDFDRFIAINKKIEEVFIREKKIKPEKIDLIYSAIDSEKILNSNIFDKSELFKKYNIPIEGKKIAFMGRLTNQKQPLRFLRTAKKFFENNEKHIFVLVGNGEMKNEVEKYIAKNNLSNVIRIDYVKNISEFYNIIDILFITSIFEGLPIVSIEAMTKGVPILSTDVGDMKIFLEKYKNGKVIINDNEKNDYLILEEFLNEYKEYKKNAETSKEEILNFFSSKNIADLYEDSFKKAIQKYKNRR